MGNHLKSLTHKEKKLFGKVCQNHVIQYDHNYADSIQITFWTQFTYIFAVSLIKLSILLFYQSIFSTHKFRLAVKIFKVILFLWTIAFFFASLFQAWPISYNWNEYQPGHTINEISMYLALACSELALDVAVLTFPWTVIWRLQMKTSRKLSISAIFMLGALWVESLRTIDENINQANSLAFVCQVPFVFTTTTPLKLSKILPVSIKCFLVKSFSKPRILTSSDRWFLLHIHLDRGWAVLRYHMCVSPGINAYNPERSFHRKTFQQHSEPFPFSNTNFAREQGEEWSWATGLRNARRIVARFVSWLARKWYYLEKCSRETVRRFENSITLKA